MMKKKIIFLLLTIAIASCSKDESYTSPLKGYDRIYSIIVVNEGTYAAGESVGSVSLYNPSTNEYTPSIYGGTENKGMGGSTAYAMSWADTTYVVSKDNNMGHVLSAYNKNSGSFVRGYSTENNVQGSAFAVINNKIGVLTTNKGGAIVIDLGTMTTVGKLKGTSTYTGDIAIKDNNLFIVDNQKRLLAYPLDGILDAEPKDLGAVSGGFVESNDGSLWAYQNNSTYDYEKWEIKELAPKSKLLQIDAKEAKIVSEIEVNTPIMPSFLSYRPAIMTYSALDDALIFLKSSEFDSNKIYKYFINENKLIEFYKLDKGSNFVNILYNPSNNTITAAFSYSNYANAKLITIDASSGKLRFGYDCTNLLAPNKYPAYLLLDK